jgi:hypothetical protein
MKIQLELELETLADLRPKLEAFLAQALPVKVAPVDPAEPRKTDKAKRQAKTTVTAPAGTAGTAEPVSDMALEDAAEDSAVVPSSGRRAPSAADIALGLEGDAVTVASGTIGSDAEASQQTDIEDLLADKAQLHFDFDRVLALQGRAAALGIVQAVLPVGTKTKIKDIETLPVALIPAAIAALQAAQAA